MQKQTINAIETVNSKNKLTKIFLLKYIFTKQKIQHTCVIPNQNRNVFLRSPFHFKVFKKHLNIPVSWWSVTTPFIYWNAHPTNSYLLITTSQIWYKL